MLTRIMVKVNSEIVALLSPVWRRLVRDRRFTVAGGSAWMFASTTNLHSCRSVGMSEHVHWLRFATIGASEICGSNDLSSRSWQIIFPSYDRSSCLFFKCSSCIFSYFSTFPSRSFILFQSFCNHVFGNLSCR